MRPLQAAYTDPQTPPQVGSRNGAAAQLTSSARSCYQGDHLLIAQNMNQSPPRGSFPRSHPIPPKTPPPARTALTQLNNSPNHTPKILILLILLILLRFLTGTVDYPNRPRSRGCPVLNSGRCNAPM